MLEDVNGDAILESRKEIVVAEKLVFVDQGGVEEVACDFEDGWGRGYEEGVVYRQQGENMGENIAVRYQDQLA